jgi:uncharacterized membrane protein
MNSRWLVTAVFAAGMIGLGILALVYHDFALVWQPVPPSAPGRTLLAYASGVLMLLGGAGLLFRSTAPWSMRILFPYLMIWVLLKVPALVVAPDVEANWLGTGELTVLLTGGWVLFDRLARGKNPSRLARMLFAVSLLPIGLSHLVYVKATVDLVPSWLPFRTGWAYFTGIAHMAAGVAMLLSIVPRLAATMEAAMLSLFTLLVWVPKIVATPTARLPWTAFFISWAITAAAWVVAESNAIFDSWRLWPPQHHPPERARSSIGRASDS